MICQKFAPAISKISSVFCQPALASLLSISLNQLTVMLGPGQLGHLAPPHADGEPKTGRGKNRTTSLTHLSSFALYPLSQGKHCKCQEQWGEVRKAPDNRACRNGHMQCDLQPPWYLKKKRV